MSKSLLLLLLLFTANSFAQDVSIGINRDYQRTWSRMHHKITTHIKLRVQEALLDALNNQETDANVKIMNVGATTMNVKAVPGLEYLDKKLAIISLPNNGSWAFRQEARIRFQKRVFGRNIRKTTGANIQLNDLKIKLKLHFHDDGKKLYVTKVEKPEVLYNLKLTVSNTILNSLAKRYQKKLNEMLKTKLEEKIAETHVDLIEMVRAAKDIPGHGRPDLLEVDTDFPFESIALGIDDKIRKYNLSNGMIMRAEMDSSASTSWEEAYGINGSGIKGNRLGFSGYGDSAIWTGHYLASQAFRYAVTKDQTSLENAKETLRGIGILIDVNGGENYRTGLLARSAFATNTPMGKKVIKLKEGFRRRVLDGVEYISVQNHNGISRDQYSGVFFGLSLAHDLIEDAEVKKMAKKRIGQMLDYIIANNWIVDEDRGDIAEGSESTPTMWAGINYQKVTMIIMGNHLFPGKYDKELSEILDLAKAAWFPLWTGILDPVDSYYKFNLDYANFYNYFRLDKNVERRAFMLEAMDLVNRHIGHHLNPYFDTAQVSIEPNKYFAKKAPEIRESLRLFAKRNHRRFTPSNLDFTGVEFIETKKWGKISKYPLPSNLRRYTGHFQWQRAAFRPALPGEGNAKVEKPGTDYTLPYWMGRYHGIFK